MAIAYTVVRSARRRSVQISVVLGGEVIVRAPTFSTEADIARCVSTHEVWIVRNVERLKGVSGGTKLLSRKAEGRLYKMEKGRASVLASALVEKWNRHYGFVFSKISIRNSKTRWGSCSSSGTLSFNYKIVFLPAELADYLVVHELCHLREHNHSKAFWGRVAETIPDYIHRRKQLRTFDATSQLAGGEI